MNRRTFIFAPLAAPLAAPDPLPHRMAHHVIRWDDATTSTVIGTVYLTESEADVVRRALSSRYTLGWIHPALRGRRWV